MKEKELWGMSTEKRSKTQIVSSEENKQACHGQSQKLKLLSFLLILSVFCVQFYNGKVLKFDYESAQSTSDKRSGRYSIITSHDFDDVDILHGMRSGGEVQKKICSTFSRRFHSAGAISFLS